MANLVAVAIGWFIPDRRLQNCIESSADERVPVI
jgi:hypothetical protein